MNRLLSLLAFAASLSLATVSAHADTLDFTYTGFGISAAGTLETTDLGNGQLLVTSISGTRNGVEILSLDTTNLFGSNDNLLFPTTSTFFSFSGISFQTVDGVQYNIYSSNSADKETVSSFDDGTAINFSLSPDTAPTPEPSTFILFGTGLLGAAQAARRRFVRA